MSENTDPRDEQITYLQTQLTTILTRAAETLDMGPAPDPYHISAGVYIDNALKFVLGKERRRCAAYEETSAKLQGELVQMRERLDCLANLLGVDIDGVSDAVSNMRMREMNIRDLVSAPGCERLDKRVEMLVRWAAIVGTELGFGTGPVDVSTPCLNTDHLTDCAHHIRGVMQLAQGVVGYADNDRGSLNSILAQRGWAGLNFGRVVRAMSDRRPSKHRWGIEVDSLSIVEEDGSKRDPVADPRRGDVWRLDGADARRVAVLDADRETNASVKLVTLALAGGDGELDVPLARYATWLVGATFERALPASILDASTNPPRKWIDSD